MGFHHVDQTCHKLLTSSNLSAWTSQSAGTTASSSLLEPRSSRFPGRSGRVVNAGRAEPVQSHPCSSSQLPGTRVGLHGDPRARLRAPARNFPPGFTETSRG
ncbi:hypothetical protein AAY473_018141 [Plecturocebus cupreus]